MARFDGDTWDLSNSVGATATGVRWDAHWAAAAPMH